MYIGFHLNLYVMDLNTFVMTKLQFSNILTLNVISKTMAKIILTVNTFTLVC